MIFTLVVFQIDTTKSGILELLKKGDDCTADKGFNIKDLLEPIGVTLNIPPFLSDKAQFNEEEAENTQSVASIRIHVERATSRIKMYQIITNALVSGRSVESDLDSLLHAVIIPVPNY